MIFKMSFFERFTRNDRTVNFVLLSIAVSAGIYIFPKAFSISHPDFGLDFRVIWLAGKFWATGQNPYGPDYIEQYLRIFGPGWDYYWSYPPNWYPLAVLFSLAPFWMANILWSIFNIFLLISATYLIARPLANLSGRQFIQIFLAGLAFACLMQATAITLYIGQTSILVYFGLSSFIFGILEKRPSALIVGLVVLALKPQIGVVGIAAVAGLKHYRWTLLPTAVLGAISVGPVILKGDLLAALQGMAHNIAQYSSIAPIQNSPPNLTGLINLVDYASGGSIQSFNLSILLVACGAINAFIIFRFWVSNKPAEPSAIIATLWLFVASTFTIIPLHSYDHTALATVSMMMLACRSSDRVIGIFGLLICMRPSNLYSILGVAHPGSVGSRESLLMTIGLLLLFLAAIRTVYSAHPVISDSNCLHSSEK